MPFVILNLIANVPSVLGLPVKMVKVIVAIPMVTGDVTNMLNFVRDKVGTKHSPQKSEYFPK